MEALQATLGQFMGTVNEMVGWLAQREGTPPREETGKPPGDARGEPPEGLEGLRRRLVAEIPWRKPVDSKRYDGKGSPWDDLIKFELTANWNWWDEVEEPKPY